MINKNEDALKLIVKSIEKSGFKNGKDISICLDVAANELLQKNKYAIHSKKFISIEKSITEYAKASSKLNIFSNVSTYIQNGDQSDELKVKLRDAEMKIQDIEKDFDSKLDFKIRESFSKFATEFEEMMEAKNKEFIDQMAKSDEIAIKKMQMINVIKKQGKKQ